MSDQLRKLLQGMGSALRVNGPDLPVQRACTRCGASIVAYTSHTSPECGQCWDARDREKRRAYAEERRQELPLTIPRLLKSCGVGRAYLDADVAKLDMEFLAMVGPAVEPMLAAPWAPCVGFGLIGDTGTGKTHACAAVFRAWTEARANYSLNRHLAMVGPWGVFTCWEEELSNLRGLMRERGPEFGDRMEHLKTCSLLVLDDLGAEKAQDAEESWSAQQLFEILNARINEERAILWTSNLNLTQLMERYGKRLVSRLTALAPAMEVPLHLEDRRSNSNFPPG